ncbi:hypothetical protein BKA67DRAFT_660277 [Truncatella angustata]|uniref:Uncharacterized protein n=1 Tax=Truncatella angustata TaxID=152316 RepID=A0A9P8ZUR1_9PEZI|nr:uncharacterized protein BKA67DRAFT_660277 [Truncatella angustata]KAH6651465.1 hypothetical protein BKA67DRAFT_660277 [Truncatella angustata]KAH8203764.1 hypothetical protein TruAng_002057 [Truncatella angustata]
MHFSAVLAVGLAVGLSLEACPYIRTREAPRDCPYAAKLSQDNRKFHQITKRDPPATDKLGVMYMNRIAPSGSQLWISNADGSDAVKLLGDQTAPMDYHATWSRDGEWVVFTSERRADGQSDIYRVKPDGSTLETLVLSDSFEDAASLSPDGTKLVYVSTAINSTANVFVLDLKTNTAVNITGSDETIGDFASPHGFFRPSWSPNGEWIALTSDANTDWTGHSNGTGWEHTQTLSLYVIRPDGTDFRKVVGQPGHCLGSPSWSPDGTRLVYYNLTTEDTYNAHGIGGFGGGGGSGGRPNGTLPGNGTTPPSTGTGNPGFGSSVVSQLFTVDVNTGTDFNQLTFGTDLVVSGQYMGNSTNVGYLIKAGVVPGIGYTIGDTTYSPFNGTLRNPSWSPDGSKVVYEVYEWDQRPAEKPLFSWDNEWEYRFMDVFPQWNNATQRLVTTDKQIGDASSSVLITDADYSDPLIVFDVHNVSGKVQQGVGGAYQPTWKPDGSQLAVGFGSWFAGRESNAGTIYLLDSDGTNHQNLTDGSLNAGFPSFSPDGTKLVFRLWDYKNGPLGLHILDLETGNTTKITNGWDNTPGWSPDGHHIVFARQTNWTAEYGGRWYDDRFDIATVKPDGTGLKILTESHANDAHAVWAPDGRIMYNSGMHGFRDESPLYDNTFQPYGQIIIMNADGSNKTALTDSMWEDSMPQYIPSSSFA